MNRRQFLECAAILVSGSSISRMAFSLSEQQQVYLATAPAYIAKEINYFTAEQRKVIAAMSEIVIPATETPGAVQAGVPKFIELMVSDWLTAEEKAIFDTGLRDLEVRIKKENSRPFYELTPKQQLSIMEEMEAAVSDSAWYEFGNIARDFVSDAPFICQLKELTIWGFFTSEVGAREVLRYNPMPMRFDGNTERSPEDSSWFSNL